MQPEILSKIKAKPILVGWRGSIAHGMYIPPENDMGTDDKDLMAVVVPPSSYYLGLYGFGSRGTQEISESPWDIVAYELKKFIALLEQGNPNVLSLLWIDNAHIITETTSGALLRENKHLFTGKHTYSAFIGYAHAQLERMTRGEGASGRGFMGNKRKAIKQQFGYDTKNASHLIRLLRMGIEFLSTGNLYVDRTNIDATELIAIKQGKWSLDQIITESNSLFEQAKIAVSKSTLPDSPDHQSISDLCVSILEFELSL